MPQVTNIRKLVINKCTDEQYNSMVKNADELYLTPDSAGSGSVTSVRVQATSPVVSSQSTEQTTTLNTTISLANNYGDTKNPYASKAANYVLAAPNGSAGTPSFRALVKADIPLASETAASGGTTTSLVTTGEKYTWNSKQDALTAQTAYTSKGSATKVPQITTNTLGQVTEITEIDITHQSIKTLKTDNTTAQSTSSSEAIAGSGTINLHKVSKTGSYDDLLNKPTIPTVNNSTITIQKNSTTVDSFTTNAASGKTINITVPTTVAELNDAEDYVPVDSLAELASVAITGSYNDLTDKPIPDQTGNSGKFLTTNGTTTSWANVDALPSQSGQSGKYLTTDGTTASWATVQAGPKFLSFTNISASNWVVDNTYQDYGYKCVLTCNGVTSADYAQVIFGPTQATNGNYANVCLTGTDSVTIYSKVNTAITIPAVIILGGNA